MSQRLQHEQLTILMVDDSQEDVFFVQRALKKWGKPHVLQAVTSGQAAVEYLQATGPYKDRKKHPFPNVMLCDINMPGMDGFAILGWLYAHPECRVIPTIMFSSSAEGTDVHRSYLAGANAYLQKPTSPEKFAEDIAALVEFWSRAQVPPLPPGEKCAKR